MPQTKTRGTKTHKTPALMKLLTSGSRPDNPFIDDSFKGDLILPEKPAPVRRYNPGEEFDLDIITELASEFLPTAIERFGCCKCDRCFADMLSHVIERCPHALIKIRSKDDFLRAEYLKEHHRNAVLRQVVHVAISYRNRKKHLTPRIKM
ncbi:MAG: hypothetical protein LBL98_01850 [Ruminococcus sp.]|jgi:hypothetical protein|nr:hypothetical protein [Ruminococcus sp.]